MAEFDERDLENVNFAVTSDRTASGHKRKDSYDYVSTVQMLGEYIYTVVKCIIWHLKQLLFRIFFNNFIARKR